VRADGARTRAHPGGPQGPARGDAERRHRRGLARRRGLPVRVHVRRGDDGALRAVPRLPPRCRVGRDRRRGTVGDGPVRPARRRRPRPAVPAGPRPDRHGPAGSGQRRAAGHRRPVRRTAVGRLPGAAARRGGTARAPRGPPGQRRHRPGPALSDDDHHAAGRAKGDRNGGADHVHRRTARGTRPDDPARLRGRRRRGGAVRRPPDLAVPALRLRRRLHGGLGERRRSAGHRSCLPRRSRTRAGLAVRLSQPGRRGQPAGRTRHPRQRRGL